MEEIGSTGDTVIDEVVPSAEWVISDGISSASSESIVTVITEIVEFQAASEVR